MYPHILSELNHISAYAVCDLRLPGSPFHWIPLSSAPATGIPNISLMPDNIPGTTEVRLSCYQN